MNTPAQCGAIKPPKPDIYSEAPYTQAYIAKRTAEGKTPREAQRCLKRYIARQIYRLLQHPKINT